MDKSLEIFDPRQPDLALICRDGEVVQTHSCMLMLASQPLVPAIKMALAESTVATGMATCRVEQDSAEAWQLLLQFLDPNQLYRPEITWVSTPG
jgi:hypothetical protein